MHIMVISQEIHFNGLHAKKDHVNCQKLLLTPILSSPGLYM